MLSAAPPTRTTRWRCRRPCRSSRRRRPISPRWSPFRDRWCRAMKSSSRPRSKACASLELLVDEGDRVKKGDVLAVLVQEYARRPAGAERRQLARWDGGDLPGGKPDRRQTRQARRGAGQFERAKPLKNSGYLSGSDLRPARGCCQERRGAARRGARTASSSPRPRRPRSRRSAASCSGSAPTPRSGRPPTASSAAARRASAAWPPAPPTPMFRIVAHGEVELDAEVIETELAKVDDRPEGAASTSPASAMSTGTVRLVSPEVDKPTRLGRVRVFLGDDAAPAHRHLRPRHHRDRAKPRPRRAVVGGRLRRAAAPTCRSCVDGRVETPRRQDRTDRRRPRRDARGHRRRRPRRRARRHLPARRRCGARRCMPDAKISEAK